LTRNFYDCGINKCLIKLRFNRSRWLGGSCWWQRWALEAGNDIVMLSKTPELDDPVWTSLLDAYRHEKKFRSRVRDAARRVLLMKLDRLRSPLAPPLVPDPATVRARVPDPEGKAFFLDLAARSATVVRNASGVLPLRAADAGRMLLAGQFDDFLTVSRAAFPSAETYKLSYAPGAETSAAEKAELVRRAKTADSVILCLANSSSLAALQALRPLGKRIIVLSVLSPALLDEVPWAASSVAVSGPVPSSIIETRYCISAHLLCVGAPLVGGRSPLLRRPLPRSDTAARISSSTFWYTAGDRRS